MAFDEVYLEASRGEMVGAGQMKHTARGLLSEPPSLYWHVKERIQADLGKVEVSDIAILL